MTDINEFGCKPVDFLAASALQIIADRIHVNSPLGWFIGTVERR
jgi:hypothetical protein